MALLPGPAIPGTVQVPPNSTGVISDCSQVALGGVAGLTPILRQNVSIGDPNSQTLVATVQQSQEGTGALLVAEKPDAFGSNDQALSRRLLELILIELMTLNSNITNSVLLQTSVQATETVASVQ